MPPVRGEHVGAGRPTERGESIAQGQISAPVAGTGNAGTMVPNRRPTIAETGRAEAIRADLGTAGRLRTVC
jgi:hypothetical protein